MTVIDKLRQPEYIGENRCTPCTAVNVVIAGGVSVLVAIASTFLGAGVFALSLGTIYLRGYLVPGTPTLTKRYFPEGVLQWFDKDSTTPITGETVEIDPEQVLLDARVVKPCREGADLCLTSEFQQAWRERIHTIRAHGFDKDHLMDTLGISVKDDQPTVDQHGDAVLAYSDNAVIGQWSSQAAVIADVAAATELSKRTSDWAEFSPAEIVRVLMSLRIFLEQCPVCDSSVQVEQEVVESCCRSYNVIASACQNCDARLFEIEWDDTDADESQTQPNHPTQTSA